jgi:prolyl oligopeptidase
MLRYHTAGSGKTWISEYGSAERAEDFSWLRAYSPYQQIDPDTEYPALLMHSAANDDRVDPLHARKFTAALQATAGDAPVWLRVERQAGHGGADLVRAAVAQGVDTYAFLLDQLLGDG